MVDIGGVAAIALEEYDSSINYPVPRRWGLGVTGQVPVLRAICVANGLDSTGTKDILSERLKAAFVIPLPATLCPSVCISPSWYFPDSVIFICAIARYVISFSSTLHHTHAAVPTLLSCARDCGFATPPSPQSSQCLASTLPVTSLVVLVVITGQNLIFRLYYNSIGDAGARELTACLQTNTTITSLEYAALPYL